MAGIKPGDRRFRDNVAQKREELETDCSSSIGTNSDLEDEREIQSSYRGAFDSMAALEEVLPIRRGISKFYNGKSKSFTSLPADDDEASTSMKEIAKPENAYTRKRKNLIASTNYFLQARSNLNNINGGVSKRLKHHSNQSQVMTKNNTIRSFSPLRLLQKATPDLSAERNISGLISFSLIDLQYPSISVTANNVK